jgi:hypothetical protein
LLPLPERKLQSRTATSIMIELAKPVIIAPATSELMPRVMIQLTTGALTNQAKKPREYPSNQNPNSTIFRPMMFTCNDAGLEKVKWGKVVFLDTQVEFP